MNGSKVDEEEGEMQNLSFLAGNGDLLSSYLCK